jgi:diacylglycerol O-acyltransferase / wax synthase
MTTPTWERLGPGDLMTLWAEAPATPLNLALAGLLAAGPLLDDAGRLRLAALRAAIAAHLDRAPALRRRIQAGSAGQGRPIWVDDQGFDVTRHVVAAELPGAGTGDFLSWAATWAAGGLDRRHPLWDPRLDLDPFIDGAQRAFDGLAAVQRSDRGSARTGVDHG